MTQDTRIANEILHGKHLLENDPDTVWRTHTLAGQERRKRRIGMLSSHLKPGMKALEIGCGTGYFTRELAKTGAQITAIDISPDLIERARSEVSSPAVTFEIENAYALKYPDASFDSVIGCAILHHLELEPALREIFRVLKPGGTLYFSEPNMLNPQIALQKNIPWLKRKLGDSPDETAFFRWQIGNALKRNGFSRISVVPFDFLHPAVPNVLVPLVSRFTYFVEKIPVLSEIAGSLYIRASR